LEFVLPIVENANLLVGEAVEGRGDVIVVLAHLRQGFAGVFVDEHGVGFVGAVKRFSGGDVLDYSTVPSASHSHDTASNHSGVAYSTVVLQQR